jgi:hypothetical protein
MPVFCIHRDRWDPNHGLGSAAMHAVFETPLGATLGLAAVFGAFSALSR